MEEQNLSKAAEQNRREMELIEKMVGSPLHLCYQCGKCSAGCPMGESMDMTPRQVIRLLQLGLTEDAFKAKGPWICATCHTCTVRCPHNVPIGFIMEAVRQASAGKGHRPVPDADMFTKTFLFPVKHFGKAHEMTMTALYNLGSGHILQHFNFLPKFVSSGKLRIFPETVKDRKHLAKIFKNCEEEDRSILQDKTEEAKPS